MNHAWVDGSSTNRIYLLTYRGDASYIIVDIKLMCSNCRLFYAYNYQSCLCFDIDHRQLNWYSLLNEHSPETDTELDLHRSLRCLLW